MAMRGDDRENTVDTKEAQGQTEEHRAKKMAARVISEMSVGLTPEIETALKVATEFQGMKPSQYGRQAILEKLIREGFLKHPMQRHFQNSEAAE